jgi:hypothetical protein
MMKKIYLTETTFKNMLTEMVREVLLLESLTPDEIYNEYYSGKIGRDIFDVAIAADPTSYNSQGELKKVGSYVKWILKLYQNGSWKPGDGVETKDLLDKFNKLKSKLPAEQRDINRYGSIRQLYDILQPYLGIKSRSEIKSDAEKVYEDNEWLIIIPHTEESACYYGANTKWCTAAKEDNRFDYYNNEGPLYINIYKPTNRKYQFHFEERQFKDEEDEPIQPNTLPWTEGALAYYKSINKYVYFKFDWIGYSDSNGIVVVTLNGKINFFSLEKQDYLFPNKWFDWVDDFDSNDIARVKLNDQWNWFSSEEQGLLFPNEWFDWVDDFYNGIALVELNGKKYYFTLDGQLLDYDTEEPLSQEQVQKLFQQQQQIAEMVNRLVRNYRKY